MVGSEMVWSGGEVTVPSQLYMCKWVAICLTANAVKLCPSISYVRFIKFTLYWIAFRNETKNYSYPA